MFGNKDKESDSMKRGTLTSSNSNGGGGSLKSDAASLSESVVTTQDVDVTVRTMNNLQGRSEFLLKHKTKVSKVRPPSRIVYEWEWDIHKFDKPFPAVLSDAATINNNAGRSRALRSEKMIAGADIGRKSEWYFQISEYAGRLSWYVILGKVSKSICNPKCIHAAFTFKVVDHNGRELLQKKRLFRDFYENYKFGWEDVIDLEKLYAQKDIFLNDNTLRTQVLFEMYGSVEQSQNEALKQERSDFARLMTTDMHRLRVLTGTADVHLECEGKVFPVHKLILSARSGTFARMFDIPMNLTKSQNSQATHGTAGGDVPPDKEHQVSSVSISDVESNILEVVLDYIYSGNVKHLTDPHLMSGVVRAADKFELLDLKSFCFNALMNYVNEENIGNLLILAHRHKAEKNVKSYINEYCLRNLTTLMRRKCFRDALKTEPDAFFADDDNFY